MLQATPASRYAHFVFYHYRLYLMLSFSVLNAGLFVKGSGREPRPRQDLALAVLQAGQSEALWKRGVLA